MNIFGAAHTMSLKWTYVGVRVVSLFVQKGARWAAKKDTSLGYSLYLFFRKKCRQKKYRLKPAKGTW